MNKYLLSFLILTMTIPTIADGHSNAEKTVIANVEAYWDARNKKDFKTVVALSSKAGMLGTNLMGAFINQTEFKLQMNGQQQHRKCWSNKCIWIRGASIN